QGIVIGFEDEELEPSVNLKGISELLDVEPVLTDEQLWLADEMRHSVFSYKISCLKAMLPNLLNSNYDKLLKSTDGT
ncbi:primosomal protein N' family DNA-binding protein, partial [Mycobacterium kansasii]